MTTKELKELFPRASQDFLKENADDYRANSPLPNTKPKRHAAPALGSPAKGKAKSLGRTIVSFVGYRNRLLDPDNFAGSVKGLLDGLRVSGLIVDDRPDLIELQTSQVKVSKKEEKTIIRITYP